MNVLDVTFDSKLTWSTQIAHATQKGNKALHAIWLIRKYFNNNEICTLLTSKFFSILYYSSEIWHIFSLSPDLKQQLLSTSTNALKLSQTSPSFMKTFVNIPKECKRSQLEQMIIYKHAILLHKLYNKNCPERDWLALNFQQVNNQRQTKLFVIKKTTTGKWD